MFSLLNYVDRCLLSLILIHVHDFVYQSKPRSLDLSVLVSDDDVQKYCKVVARYLLRLK